MDWGERLTELKRLHKDKDTPLDDYMHFFRESLNLCRNWDTCAVGENKHQLRLKGFKFKKISGEPLDHKLSSNGTGFDEAILNEDFEIATEIYQDILNY